MPGLFYGKKSSSLNPDRGIRDLLKPAACVIILVLALMSLFYLNLTLYMSSSSDGGVVEEFLTGSSPQLPTEDSSRLPNPSLPSKSTSTSTSTSSSSPTPFTKMHLMFSTDCTPYQNWQSYLLFHSALRVSQPGDVTRVVSGCSPEQQSSMSAWHETYVSGSMSRHFHVHFTPTFDKTDSGSEYKFFNKPFGLLHWLENGIGLDPVTGKLKPEDATTIFAVLDPDMVLIKPLVNDFSSPTEHRWTVPKRQPRPTRVTDGRPVAQVYGLGSKWTTFPLASITGNPSTPALSVGAQAASDLYAAGPPFLLSGRDMLDVAVGWAAFVKPVNEIYPTLLGEMYAFCVAAADRNLPFDLASSFMVSALDAEELEAFPLLSDADVRRHCDGSLDTSTAKGQQQLEGEVPFVLHYCQNYRVGQFAFHKGHVPHDVFTCDAPLMIEPDGNVVDQLYKTQGPSPVDGSRRPNVQYTKDQARNAAFMLCGVLRGINEAATFFKDKHCGDKGGGNRSKEWSQLAKEAKSYKG